ncbi:MAG: lipid-A-disaccharide synthase, partial [Pseudomonadota bacterium]
MKVFVIAGEASGDKLGGALMAGLSSLAEVTYSGVGGPMMQAPGLRSLFDLEELSVMGLVEILPGYFDLKR